MPQFEVEVIDEAGGSTRWVPVTASDAAAAREKVKSFGEVVGRARLLSADDAAPIALAKPPAVSTEALPAGAVNQGTTPPTDAERTLLVAKPSKRAIGPTVLFWTPFFILGVEFTLTVSSSRILQGAIFFAAIVVVLKLLQLSSTSLTITTRRIRWESGLLTPKSIELPISQVKTVDINPAMLGWIFGYQHVRISDTGSTMINARRLANTREVQAAINDALHAAGK